MTPKSPAGSAPGEDALREARALVSPKAIAAAWDAWHARHGGKLGPGPAFAEAITAGVAVALSERTSDAATADLKARIAGLEAELRYETDARGAWAWVVWAISEKSAQLAAICSSKAEAERHAENVPALYPEAWALHERAPVDHTFGKADLKALHWRSALAGARRVRGDARAALSKDTAEGGADVDAQ